MLLAFVRGTTRCVEIMIDDETGLSAQTLIRGSASRPAWRDRRVKRNLGLFSEQNALQHSSLLPCWISRLRRMETYMRQLSIMAKS